MDKLDFFKICDFMITDLLLSGNDLLVYALIYSFKNSKEQKFYGSLKYIAYRLNMSKSTVQRSLKKLVDKGYLIKSDIYKDNQKFCEYTVNSIYTPKENNSPPKNKKKNIIDDDSYFDNDYNDDEVVIIEELTEEQRITREIKNSQIKYDKGKMSKKEINKTLEENLVSNC